MGYDLFTKFDSRKPFNELPLLPPKVEIETKKVLKKCADARAALAELKGTAKIIPNQSILLNTISLQEAKDSSEIENIITTNDSLYKALASKFIDLDPSTKEVLHYREALWKGYKEVQEKGILNSNSILLIQETIIRHNAGVRKLPGTTVQNKSTGEIIYTPPYGEDLIRKLLANLEKYINTNGDFDPLIKLAVIHYQFEAIHPFYDGNGRTGRILNVLYLILKDMLDIPILYLSSYIIKNKKKYYELLKDLPSHGVWEDWILYILTGIEETSKQTVDRINKIKTLMDDTIIYVRNNLPRMPKKELVELIFEHPYTKTDNVVKKGIASRNTASKYLRSLTDHKLLEKLRYKRENLYINSKLLDILSA